MLTDQELIIATMKYTKEDRSKSWTGVLTSFFLLLVSVALTLSTLHWGIRIFFSITTGLLLVRLFILYHDYLHRAILRKSRVADALFTFYGWLILVPKVVWNRSHNYHHGKNSKFSSSFIGSFPIISKQQYLEANDKFRRQYLIARHPLIILLGYFFVFAWGMCLRPYFKNPKANRHSLIAIGVHLSVGTLIWVFFGWQGFVLGFFFPFILACGLGSYLFYAQHNFPSVIFRSEKEWGYMFAALHSSSYMKMNKVMRWFTGNIGYHHIHHVNSKIPFYNLPRVYEEIEELQSPGVTSLSLKEVIACLRLKLWDAEQQRMIRLNEL